MILQYVLPGYWSVFLFKYFTSKKCSKELTIVISCVVSYILIALIALVRPELAFIKEIPNIAIINSGIAIIVGTIISMILAFIFCTKTFSKILVFLFHKTPNEDIWRDILDLKEGSNLKIYLRDKDYYIIGHHKNHEEKGEDSWIAVSAFGKFDVETNENYTEEPSFLDDENVVYTVRLSDVEHIEIF